MWARHIEDDSRLVVDRIGFEGDDGQGAEEQVTGVGRDGGAAGSDFVAGLKLPKPRESPALHKSNAQRATERPLRRVNQGAQGGIDGLLVRPFSFLSAFLHDVFVRAASSCGR
jgi:hypothetical protein